MKDFSKEKIQVNTEKSVEPKEIDSTPTKTFNEKEVLMNGELFLCLNIKKLSIVLTLKDEYISKENYFILNRALGKLYYNLPSFRKKFTFPRLTNEPPVFKLKKGKYENPKAFFKDLSSFVENSFIDFSPPSPIEYEKELEVTSDVQKSPVSPNKITEDFTKSNIDPNLSLLQEEYINSTPMLVLYFPVIIADPLRSEFKQREESETSSLLLPEFKRPYRAKILVGRKKKYLKIKKTLAEGKLLSAVIINKLNVELILSKEYDFPHSSVNNALYHLCCASPLFQEKFETPKQGNHPPFLTLKEEGSYNPEELLKTLINFASKNKKQKKLIEELPYKKPKVKPVLASIVKNAPKVKPILTSIVKNKPKVKPVLASIVKKKPKVKSVLTSKVKSKPKGKTAWLEALIQNKLFSAISIMGSRVDLIVSDKYNFGDNYSGPNRSLDNLYCTSSSFREKFERPKQGKHSPFLILKKEGSYEKSEDILTDLIGFALKNKNEARKKLAEKLKARSRISKVLALKDTKKAKKHTGWIKYLAEGELFTNAIIHETNVELVLNNKYNSEQNYPGIKKSLYNLFRTSASFKEKFKNPSRAKTSTFVLILKNKDTYKNSQDLLQALISFVLEKKLLSSQKKTLAVNSLSKGPLTRPLPLLLQNKEQEFENKNNPFLNFSHDNMWNETCLFQSTDLSLDLSDLPLCLEEEITLEQGKLIGEAVEKELSEEAILSELNNFEALPDLFQNYQDPIECLKGEDLLLTHASYTPQFQNRENVIKEGNQNPVENRDLVIPMFIHGRSSVL